MRRVPFVALAALIASGCTSLRDEAVPGCPHCGDPAMRVGEDGREEVVPRWRLVTWSDRPVAAPARSAPSAAGPPGR